MTTAGYALYWEALSGAIVPQAMLEEMGLAYEKLAVDMARGEHRTPAYLKLNPTGQVPALRLPEGTVIGESAAIAIVLGDRHPEHGLVPPIEDPERPNFLRWLLFMATSVYMAYVRFNHPERFTDEEPATASIRAVALRRVEECFASLDAAITGSPYFMPRGYGGLDIYLSMLVLFHPDPDGLGKRNPRVGALFKAVAERPAFARVMVEHLPAPS